MKVAQLFNLNSQLHLGKGGLETGGLHFGMTVLVTDKVTVSTHIALLAQPFDNLAATDGTRGGESNVLGHKDVVVDHVQLQTLASELVLSLQ